MQAAAQPDDVRPWHYDVLPPLVAFTGILLLLFFSRENWLYELPIFKGTAQVRSLTSPLLQGQVQCPLLVHPESTLKVRGWVRSLMPGVEPRKMVVYLDGQQVGETAISSNRNALPKWQLDFFLAGAPLGEHTISVQAVFEGHEPILAVEVPLSIQ